MFSNIFALVVLGLVCQLGQGIDSDGTDFVFSYSAYSEVPFFSTASASVVIIPATNVPTTCTLTWTISSTGKPGSINYVPIYGRHNEYFFKFDDVVLIEQYDPDGFDEQVVPDFRIFAHCNQKVKLIGRISDPINSLGDLFLIPSVDFATSRYVIEFPTTSSEFLGSVSVLPVSTIRNVNVSIATYIDGIQWGRVKTFDYDASPGAQQRYMSLMFNRYSNASLIITSDSNIMLLVTAPYVTPSSSGFCGMSCEPDYVAFMPIGSAPKQCGSKTKKPEERMTTHDFASRYYISPPNVDDTCNDDPKITVYDDITNMAAGRSISVSKVGQTAVSVINKNQTGFLTYEGPMPTYRLGSVVQNDGITAFGHFAHYLPSTLEWISGPTQFYTLANNCFLEIYIKSQTIDLTRVKIDGVPLANLRYTETYIEMFVVNLMQYIVPVDGYGLHNFENDAGTSVSYVVCKSVNGPYNAAGYLTGFNKVSSE